MIQIIGSYSTRNTSKQSLKHINSARYFKRVHNTDQNEKNTINYVDKIIPLKNKSGISIDNDQILSNKNYSNKKNQKKKSIYTISNLSGKLYKIYDGSGYMIKSTKNIQNKENKDNKYNKNFKIIHSIQFNKNLSKSTSSTTINKKNNQKNSKIIDKITGNTTEVFKKNIKKKSNTLENFLKINQFKLGKKLGSGRFGNVYFAQDKDTKLIYAIKVLNKNKIKQAKMQQQIIMEIKLQSFMNHPNLLKMYGYFCDGNNIYLILQYCSHCLFRDFRTKGKFNQEETAYYGKQVISALKYMHNENIIHRDIKPQNILVQHGVLKLSDFGWSTYSPLYKRQTFCGTIDYVPPQIVQGISYDERVDIWAFGVLLYQLVSGKAPFQTQDENITYQKILYSECKFPYIFSLQLINLIKKILDKNPKNRPNLSQIQQHCWFNLYKTTGRYIAKPIWNAWNLL